MGLQKKEPISLEEFYRMRETTDLLLEYIDGIVYMSPSPSTKHQRTSMRLSATLFSFLQGKPCEVFSAPFDVELQRDAIKGNTIVMPDLSVICDTTGLTDQKYVGVPTVIIEILSPSNQSHDLVTKLNLYMHYGVKEYWIVNPISDSILIYTLDEKGEYGLDIAPANGIAHSSVLKGFTVNLSDLFANLSAPTKQTEQK